MNPLKVDAGGRSPVVWRPSFKLVCVTVSGPHGAHAIIVAVHKAVQLVEERLCDGLDNACQCATT